MSAPTIRLPGIRSTPAPVATPAPAPEPPAPARDFDAEMFARWLHLARDFTAARLNAEFFARYPASRAE